MASLKPDEITFTQLLALGVAFRVSETSLRTTLSRMSHDRLIEIYRKGKTALYSLTGRSRRISKNVAAGFMQSEEPNWKGVYWGVGFSVPESKGPERHRIRCKLEAYRYAAWFPGFWIRPELDTEEPYNGLEDLGKNAFCRLLEFKPENPISKEDISAMWKLDHKAEQMQAVQKDLEVQLSKVSCLGPIEAFRKRMIIGKTVIQALSSDPLLPGAMLPSNWPGPNIRSLFKNWQEAVEPRASEFYKSILAMEEK